MKSNKKLIINLLVVVLFFGIYYFLNQDTNEDVIPDNNISENNSSKFEIKQDGYYVTKEDVSLYVHIYKDLPNNYITKKEAQDLGWQASKANLWDVSDKKSIGGDRFGNREGLLPKKDKRQYYEADIDYDGTYRNEKRIVYSNDGLIYYTDDHYKSFELLYGDE